MTAAPQAFVVIVAAWLLKVLVPKCVALILINVQSVQKEKLWQGNEPEGGGILVSLSINDCWNVNSLPNITKAHKVFKSSCYCNMSLKPSDSTLTIGL